MRTFLVVLLVALATLFIGCQGRRRLRPRRRPHLPHLPPPPRQLRLQRLVWHLLLLRLSWQQLRLRHLPLVTPLTLR